MGLGRNRPRWFLVPLFLAALGADQASKAWAQDTLATVRELPAIPGLFQFTYVQNTGVAFGFAAGRNLVFIITTLLLLAFGLFFARKLNWRLAEVNVVAGLLTAGAVGNLIDRFRFGYVIDFLDFHAIGYPWVFNIADSCIVGSVIWILLRQMGLGTSRLPSPMLADT